MELPEPAEFTGFFGVGAVDEGSVGAFSAFFGELASVAAAFVALLGGAIAGTGGGVTVVLFVLSTGGFGALPGRFWLFCGFVLSPVARVVLAGVFVLRFDVFDLCRIGLKADDL